MKGRYVLSRVFAYIFDFSFVQILIGIFFVSSADSSAQELLDYVNSTSAETIDPNVMQKLSEDVFVASSNDALFIIFSFIIYFVIIAKLLGGKTIGCYIFKQKIVKTDNTKLTYSDLTLKMLLTNGGIYYVFLALIFTIFSSNISTAVILFSLLMLAYSIFIFVNFIFLVTSGISLVDKITKTRPLLIKEIIKQST